jgi:hypothetical protein
MGCGGNAGGDSAPGDEQLAARDNEVARVQEQIGEASCATTSADATLDASTAQYANTAMTTYDHTTCRNAYIVDVNNVPGSELVKVAGGASNANLFACFFSITLETLYEKKNGTYVKIGDALAFGAPVLEASSGSECRTQAQIAAPEAGDYKVITDSFQFLGPQLTVSVFLAPN